MIHKLPGWCARIHYTRALMTRRQVARPHNVPHRTPRKPWIFYAHRWESAVKRCSIIGIRNMIHIAVDSLYPHT